MNILEAIENGIKKVVNDEGQLQEDVKKAILHQFKNNPQTFKDNFSWSDKLDWLTGKDAIHFRMCPGAWIRKGSYIGQNVVLMPCFVNVGSYIGSNTMIDSGVTIGSCAQIGENCHISSNVVIAGVLEPIQAMPVIIENNCMIGAGSTISEGVHIGKNSIIASGCNITSSTRIYDRQTGEYWFGKIPNNSVVVPGSYKTNHDLQINCAIIVKTTDEKSKNKCKLNELLRD